MEFKCMQTGPYGVNTYIINSEESKTCIVIDPADAKKVNAYLDEKGLKIELILLTHGHFDHILSVAKLKEEHGAKVCIHENEKDAFIDGVMNLGAPRRLVVPPCEVDILNQDGMKMEAAGLKFKVMHTPGHSSGSVSYIFEDEKIIFSGDTLFHLSIGRSDFANSSTAALHSSIKNKLYALEGDYKVCPGHGDFTSLEFERNNNPYVR